MGKINQGILGGVSGTVGSVVGASWKGISYLRGKATSHTDANTESNDLLRVVAISGDIAVAITPAGCNVVISKLKICVIFRVKITSLGRDQVLTKFCPSSAQVLPNSNFPFAFFELVQILVNNHIRQNYIFN